MLLIEKRQAVAIFVALSAALTGSFTAILAAVQQRKKQAGASASTQGRPR